MKDSTYILVFTPEQPNQIRQLFEFGKNMPNEILENPASLRYAGWNMETRDRSHIIDGNHLQLKNGDRKTLRLYEDGTFAVTGAITSDFLAWGEQNSNHGVNVHGLAMIEFTTEFVYLYKRLVDYLKPETKKISFHIEILNGKIGGKFMTIVPYETNTMGFIFKERDGVLTNENPKYTGDVLMEDLLNDSDKVVFEIVRRLFLFFGIAENKIPYTLETNGIRRIDLKKIKTI